MSPRTIRNWVTAGKLSAVSGKRGLLIRRVDVIELGKVSGHFSEDREVRNASGNGSPISAGNYSPSSAEIPNIDGVRLQLETIRDTLLRPLIEQNERQQETIREQAETIGDLRRRAEAAESRLSVLEVQQAGSLTQTSSAPQTATGAATDAPWWQFWKR